VFFPWISIASTEYGVVLLDKKKGVYWQVNGTGALIVDGIKKNMASDEIANVLVEAFDVDFQRAHEDVMYLVSELAEFGIVK